MSDLTPNRSSPLPQAFDVLAAEHEEAWQQCVFVEPLLFSVFAGMRSVIVFGESGSGKTALRMALVRQAQPVGQPPAYLAVEWQPSPPTGLIGSMAVASLIDQLLDSCANALVSVLACYPQMFVAASATGQDTISWLLQTYLVGDYRRILEQVEDRALPDGIDLLHKLFQQPPRPILNSNAAEKRKIAELSYGVRRLGMRGIWILVDGLEPWLRAGSAELTAMLGAMLATLELFEEPGLSFKILVPSSLEAALGSSGGPARRAEVYQLQWPEERLIAVAERRAAALAGVSELHLKDMCPASDVVPWLRRYGGSSPRGWLELVRPLAEAYVANKEQPLSTTAWQEIRRQHLPRLHIDLAMDRVFIGYGEVDELQPGGYRLLRYLYEQRPRRCTRSELYYRAYLGLSEEPRSVHDASWQAPDDWSGLIDTIIWRLRQMIELDPKKPVYIRSGRGKGVALEHTQ